MTEGYYNEEEREDPYPWLHEFLCEYVDGTMDPAARAAFEQYVRGNPQLARHVERLCQARQMLCQHGCRLHAPPDIRDRLHRRLAGEVMRTQPPLPPTLAHRLGSVASFTSVMALVLIVGMIGGAFLVPEETLSFGTTEKRTTLGRRADRLALPLPEMQYATTRVDLPASPYYHPHLTYVARKPYSMAWDGVPWDLEMQDSLGYGVALNSIGAP